MLSLEDYLLMLDENVKKWHLDHLEAIGKAWGSSHNHQAWEGGYRDHLTQCMGIASSLHFYLTECYGELSFTLASAIKVLYFHDVEKVFKYGHGRLLNDKGKGKWEPGWNKYAYMQNELADDYGVHFTPEEWSALTYIHGEGNDYRKDFRVMNELAGFCHAIDVLSARTLHNKKG